MADVTKEIIINTRWQATTTAFKAIMNDLTSLGKGLQWIGKKGFQGFRMMNNVMRKLLMAQLSVLFASMALNRVFKSMMQPILDVFQASDLWSIVMMDILLPVFETLFPYIMQLIEYLLNLPESTKKVIGAFIIFGAALTTAALVLAQIGLMFSGFGVIIGAFMGIFLLFTGLIISSAGLLKQLGTGADAAANGFINMVNKGVSWVVAWLNKLSTWFIQNQPKILEIANNIMDALMEGLFSILTALDPFVTAFLETLSQFYEAHKDQIGKIITIIMKWLMAFLTIAVPIIVDIGFRILTAILDGIQNNKAAIASAMLKVLEIISQALEANVDKIIDIGLWLAETIIEGLIRNLPKLLKAALKGAIGLAKGAFNVGLDVGEKLGAPAGGVRRFQSGGIVPGSPSTPVPIIAHGGEIITPAGGGRAGGVTLNVSYNVTVSDRREFESMLKANNNKLVEDVRRMVEI